MKGLLAGLTGLAVLALAGGAAAQAPSPPTFQTGAELVRLDVRATDSQGRPVADLKPDDLEILDRGQRRPVLLFQHVVESERSFEEAAAETIGGEVSTNVGAPRGHFYALVFDQLHITPGREQRVRTAALRFINTHLKSGDRIAIFSLPGPGASLAFTADLEKARTALESVRGRATSGGRGGTSTGIRTFEAYRILRGDDNTAYKVLARLSSEPAYAALAGSLAASTIAGGASQSDELTILREEASRIVGQADMESYTFLTLLSDVLKTMRAIEGRKAVVVFSEGFFIDSVARDLDSVASAAAESYSVVYGIDLNSFDAGADQERPETDGQLAEITERRDPLATLALETDGRLVANATNFDQIFANIAAEASDYYLVGFEPASGNRGKEGDYHRVKVTVRREGLQVRARTGYAVPGEANPATRRRSIDQALGSPFAVTALPIEYTTYLFRSATAGRQRVVMSLTASLPWTGNPNGTADVVFVARDVRTGATVASGTDRLKLPGPGSGAYHGLMPVPYRVQFELPPGEYFMRVIVREPGGLVGTADRRFRVPPLDGPGLTTSDLVVAVGDSAALDPPARATASADDRLIAYLELYGAGPVLEQVQATVEVAQKDLETVARVQPLVTDVPQRGRIVRARLPVEGLPAGSYVARVRIPSPDGPAILVTRGFELLPARSARGTAPSAFDALVFLTNPAVRAYVEQVRRNQDTAEASTLARRGIDAFERGDYVGASSAFEVMGRVTPSDAWAAFFLGASYAASGRERDAIGAWRLAALLDPRRLDTHLYLAEAYLRLHQTGLAVQVLESGMTSLPDAVELKTRLAALKR